MSVKVSVIVPVYNSEKYLEKCLNSILNQSLKEMEVIVIDDGSTDNSVEIIKSFASRDNRIKTIFQGNFGPSVARNNGIKKSNGEYITFVDSDDWVNESAYLSLYEKAIESNADVLLMQLYCWFSNKEKDYILKFDLEPHTILSKEEIKEKILPDFLYSGKYGSPIKFYKKELFIKNDLSFPEDRTIGEDWLFNMDVFTYSDSVYYYDTPFYYYRQDNNTSLMKKYRPDLYDLYIKKSPLETYFKTWGLYDVKVKWELANRKVNIALLMCILNEFKPDANSNWIAKYKNIKEMINNPEVIEAAKLISKHEKNKVKKIYIKMVISGFIPGLYIMGKLYSLKSKYVRT